jgi:rifampicin phosphotransferase
MADVTWDAPGPGSWELDLAHCLGSMTPIGQHIQGTGLHSGMRELFEEFGMPAECLEPGFCNGYFYTRLRPLIGADAAPRRPPPVPVLKLVFALHPELRRRRRRAEAVLADPPFGRAIRHWREHERPALEAENLALQDVDLASLDDDALAAHVGELVDTAIRGYHRHFVLHGHDLGPIGLLLIACRDWGIPADDVVAALEGASPSTSEPSRVLARLRRLVADSGRTPASLDDVRAISDEAAADLDHYLRYRGLHVFSRYDVDGVTLGELPEVVLATILEGRERGAGGDPEAAAAALRARVPGGDRPELDRLLDDARSAMDLRDDNGPTTAEWRLGLVRRGLLEVGRRLVERGAVEEPAHAFELRAEEVAEVLLGRGPSATELAERAVHRRFLSTLEPPATLGPPTPPPPLAALPAAQARLLDVVQTVQQLLARQARADGLAGTGVGTTPYRGRVRRAAHPEEAIASLEPGEVLVVPFTTPAYNAVLPLAGAIVTSQGGPLSHAAVLARELALPAVVGAAAAFDRLVDGTEVEVDPVAGTVRVVAAPVPTG